MKPQPSDVSISGVVRLPGHLTAPFREFNSQELPLGALAILSLLTTMYAIPTVGSFAFSFDEDKSRTQIALVKVTGALNILVIMLSWLTLYFRYYEKHSPKRMTAAKRYMGSMVQNLYSIVLILSLAVRLCARMAYGECNGNSILEQAFCNPNHSTHGLPEDTLVVVVWSPIMFPMILRDTDWIAVILHWLIATIAPLASFVSGLDMVADIAQDGLRKLSSVDNCCSEEMALYDGSHYKHLAKEVRGWLEGVLCSDKNSSSIRVGNRKTFVTNLMEKIGQVLDAPPLSSLGHSHSIHTNSARGRSDSVGLDSNFPVVSHARTMSVHLNEQSASFDIGYFVKNDALEIFK
eukprot:gene5797-6384_t